MKKVLKVLHILQVINFGTFYFQPFLLLQLLSKLSLSLSFVCLSFVGILKYYEKFIFQMWMLDLMPCTIINDNLEARNTDLVWRGKHYKPVQDRYFLIINYLMVQTVQTLQMVISFLLKSGVTSWMAQGTNNASELVIMRVSSVTKINWH